MKTKKAAIIEELEAIARQHAGLLKPRDVVDAARVPASALHSRFEWNDTKAAEEYRLWQARMLIRVCVQILPNTTQPERVWVSLRDDRQNSGYRALTSVMSDPEQREALLDEALDTLEYYQLKYGHLEELASVFREVKKARLKKAA